MADAGIGRLLIASLHQGIADVAPTRLSFYESWLRPPGLGARRVGLAPLRAALSFLRLEGRASYDQIMCRAGRYTAEWHFTNIPAAERAVARHLPPVLRARWALFLGRRLFSQTFRGSRVRVRFKRGAGVVAIRGSVFCAPRETADWPLCGYYAAALNGFLERFDLDARVAVSACSAAGGSDCTLAVTILGGRHFERDGREPVAGGAL